MNEGDKPSVDDREDVSERTAVAPTTSTSNGFVGSGAKNDADDQAEGGTGTDTVGDLQKETPLPSISPTLEEVEITGGAPTANGFCSRGPAVPGVMFIPGPGFYETRTTDTPSPSGVEAAAPEIVLQGFLPPTPEETRRQKSRSRLRHLMENAISLDASAIVPVPAGGVGGVVEQSKRKKLFRTVIAVIVGVGMIVAIGIGVHIGREKEAEEKEAIGFGDEVADTARCINTIPLERYVTAKDIATQITSADVLNDEVSPQRKALQWLVCNDKISANLLDNKDEETGLLPKQTNGFLHGGDSGEAQVLRRYILATLYYSTSLEHPWDDDWNFLSGDLHE